MSQVTTHVLDVSRGRPAPGIHVVLATDAGDVIAEGHTDDDGRVAKLGPDRLEPGGYRLRFDTGRYFAAADVASFFPEVSISFAVAGEGHHHVPLLLSPYSYTTYRGS